MLGQCDWRCLATLRYARKGLISPLISFTIKRMPTPSVLLNRCLQVVDSLMRDLEHLPNGYLMLRDLPRHGQKARHKVRKRWAILLHTSLFPPQFLTALVLAAVDVDGIPDARSSRLYHWLLRHYFHSNPREFYLQWTLEKARHYGKKPSRYDRDGIYRPNSGSDE